MLRKLLATLLIGMCIWNSGVYAARALGVDPLSDNGDENGSGLTIFESGLAIIRHPSDQVIEIVDGSEDILLTCEVEGDHIDGGYLERVDKGPIANANNKSSIYYNRDSNNIVLQLNITRANPNCSGQYRCVAYSEWGMVVSETAQVIIAVLVIIVKQPQNITTATGSNVTISITAKGYDLKYHWRKMGHDPLPDNAIGQHSPHLIIPLVALTDSGRYYCVIKDQWGNRERSDEMELKVHAAPTIKSCSPDQDLSIVNGTERVVLICEVEGDDIIGGYFERINDVPLERNHSKFIQNRNVVQMIMYKAHPSNSGDYCCVAYSKWGVTQSRIIQVNVTIAPPRIIVQPASKTVSVFESVTFTCGTEGFEVECECIGGHNGTLRSTGVNQCSLTIPQVVPSDEGSYYCIATNQGGTDRSEIAILTVNAVKEHNDTKNPKASTSKLNHLNIVIDPQSDSVVVGSYATFTCSPSVSSSAMAFQWLYNGTIMDNEIDAVLNLTNVKESDSGTYQCVVVLNNVTVNSSSASLYVFYQPVMPTSSRDIISKYKSVGIIVTTCILVGILIIIIGCCCCCCCYCHRRKKPLGVQARGDIETSLHSMGKMLTPIRSSTQERDDIKGTLEVTVSGNQSIMEIIYSLQPKMEELINMNELFGYLKKHHVLTANEQQHLCPNSNKTLIERVRYLLDSVLGSKGLEGEKSFVKALYESSKRSGVTGHRVLVKQLHDKGVVVTEQSLSTAV